MQKEFCYDCGGRGQKSDGTQCSCTKNSTFEGFGVEICDFIPADYSRLRFSESLLPDNATTEYKSIMSKTYTDICALQLKQNMFIYSRPKMGKTVFAYSSISELFNKGVKVFPLLDIMEVRRMMFDVDVGKSYLYKENANYEVEDLYNSKYLFIKITSITKLATQSMYQILDRRTRRGNFTIFLSILSWMHIKTSDDQELKHLLSLEGDGTLGTLKIVNSGGRVT